METFNGIRLSQTITEKQWNRLYAIYKKSGWSSQAFSDLLRRYGYVKTKGESVTLEHYDAMVKELEGIKL